MREIKFRVWDRDAKQFISNWVIDQNGFLSGNSDLTPYEIIQYTGLKDKNGTEIYEGDIVKSSEQYGELGMVTFNTHNFAHIPGFHICDKEGKSLNYYYGVATSNEEDEIVGNIYENPELLK